MQEIELKFQIPAEALAALSAELEGWPGHGRERLQAHYFDTPDRRLGQARSALRLRKEGERWVQTLKAVGANTMVRLEDNQPAPAPAEGSAATIDLSLHRGGAAEASLVKALGWQPAADPGGERTRLVELYRTDIWRHSARVRIGQGSEFEGVVELALDQGHILAGELSLPVRELEIELAEGHPMAVILAARDWVARHALWLDTRTKAHRGDRLAREAAGEPPPASRHQPLETANLASTLERLTDRMSLVALGTGDVDGAARSWRQSLNSLASLPLTGTPPATLSAITRLNQALDERSTAAVELARAPATTLLCLDLFAALL
ncbi:MAG: CYTH domain-containing protein [Rubrivivax sp.]|nr:MAG: CYTH domain-containing protein [Rubrivivax sp.]